jgi:hypothetical protein
MLPCIYIILFYIYPEDGINRVFLNIHIFITLEGVASQKASVFRVTAVRK